MPAVTSTSGSLGNLTPITVTKPVGQQHQVKTSARGLVTVPRKVPLNVIDLTRPATNPNAVLLLMQRSTRRIWGKRHRGSRWRYRVPQFPILPHGKKCQGTQGYPTYVWRGGGQEAAGGPAGKEWAQVNAHQRRDTHTHRDTSQFTTRELGGQTSQHRGNLAAPLPADTSTHIHPAREWLGSSGGYGKPVTRGG